MDTQNRIFYRPSHRFRNQVDIGYRSVLHVARLAYPSDPDNELESRFAAESGFAGISNMLVVYVWTLFEVYMREAYVAIHDGKQLNDGDVRKRNRGWGEMRTWLVEKKMFSKDLGRFDSLLGEFCARRNCLVHRDGKIDQQYLDQVCKYGGNTSLSLNDEIETDWNYHKVIQDVLVNRFNLFLSAEVEYFPRQNVEIV